jgi:hypothetical protein
LAVSRNLNVILYWAARQLLDANCWFKLDNFQFCKKHDNLFISSKSGAGSN